MARATVCLTFDFDAISGLLVFDSPAPVSNGEFGVVALPRILNLLEKRSLPSSWYVPGHTADTFPLSCKDILVAGHEIGMHGYLHEPVSELTPAEERTVMQRSFDAIATLTGQPPRGSRAPHGQLTPVSLDILASLGIEYDTSLMGTDYRPYYVRAGDEHQGLGPSRLGPDTRLVEVPNCWSLDDWPHFEYFTSPQGHITQGLHDPRLVFDTWAMAVEYMLRDFEDGVIVITCHPRVTGRGHVFVAFEAFVDRLMAMDVAFARVDAVVDQFKGGRQYGRYQPQAGSFREHPLRQT